MPIYKAERDLVMKIIYRCSNFMCDTLFVDTDRKVIATDEHQFEDGYYESEAGKLDQQLSMDDTPRIMLERKRDHQTLKEAYIRDGFTDITDIPAKMKGDKDHV